MKIWSALKAIKSKAKLASLQAELEAHHVAAAGPKSCAVELAYRHASAYKVGGAAYYRELCLSHANGIIHKASTQTHFLPPSAETLAWGGFMGGENLVWTDAQKADAAETRVLKTIAKFA